MKKVLIALCLLLTIQLFAQDDPAVWLYKKKQEEEEKKNPKVDTTYRVYLPIDEKGFVKYSNVELVENTDASKLYSRAKLFVAEAFKSAKSVTHLNDDDGKVIIIKPVVSFESMNWWEGSIKVYTHYQLKIECKDGRYRYTLDAPQVSVLSKNNLDEPLPVERHRNRSITKKQWPKYLERLNIDFKIVIALLKSYMAKNTDDF